MKIRVGKRVYADKPERAARAVSQALDDLHWPEFVITPGYAYVRLSRDGIHMGNNAGRATCWGALCQAIKEHKAEYAKCGVRLERE